MSNTKSYDEYRSFWKDFMSNYRVGYLLKEADKMTPIEGKVFLVLVDLVHCFGANNLNLRPQVKIGKYTVDFLILYEPLESDTNLKIIIECDGHEWHEKTKEQAAHDKERDRYLIKQGYTILHYTGSEIYNDYSKVWRDVEEMLLPEKHKCGFGYGKEFEKMIKEMSK